MTQPLVTVEDAALTLGGQAVLENVSLTLAPGRITTLIGPNGAGKSTLARLVLGLARPDRGRVTRRPGLTLGYMPQHLRVDESLWFPNARFLEDRVLNLVAATPALKDLVLMCPAVNGIDASALESLEEINRRLKDAGVTLHLTEVKGPVMDRLQRSHFVEELNGRIYLSQYEAWSSLMKSPQSNAAR